jgi:hypothetical protein
MRPDLRATVIVAPDRVAQANLRIHPLAETFPPMTGAEFDVLAADIRANGLINPITLFEGMVLDGRNRLRACEAAGSALADFGPWTIFQTDPTGKRALARCTCCQTVREISVVNGIPSCGCTGSRRSTASADFATGIIEIEARVAIGRHRGRR